MARRRFPVALVLLCLWSACSFEASCGGNTINAKKLEKGIAGYVENGVGVAPESVTCPDKVKVEDGGEFECKVVVGDQTVRVHVVQTDGDGSVSYGFAPTVLSLDKIANAAAARIKQVKGIDATVDCGGKIRDSKAGDEFECVATDGAGAKATIEILVKDDEGHFDYGELEPVPTQ